MESKLKNLMLTAVAVTASSVLAYAAMPTYDQPWPAKYLNTPIGTKLIAEDWYTMGFDDTSWDSITVPLDQTNWPGSYTACWVRCRFDVSDPSKMEGAELKVLHDDGCTVYLNDEMVYEYSSVIYDPAYRMLPSDKFKKGENVIAVYVADTGGGDRFLRFGLVQCKELSIDVPVAGAMGDSILAKVDNFSDVYALKIKGKLNSTDMETMTQRLPNLRMLDISGVDMTAIAAHMFRNNKTLTRIILPENLETIGNEAFYGCTSLAEAPLPGKLKSIGEYSFCNTVLTEVVLPEGLTAMGRNAFEYCMQNKRVSLPSTLKEVPYGAFRDNYALESVTFSEGLTTINSLAFYEARELTELKFPTTLRTIASDAFMYNRKLRKIDFNEGLSRIYDNAFYDCDSLREVTLPSTLVRADASPFDYCDNLRKVTCLSVEPPYMTDQIPYGLSMAGRELYVPALSLNIYKQTAGWDKFPTIKSIDYLPDNLIITRDEVLTLPGNLPAGYRPDLSILQYYDGYSSKYGHLEVNGDATLSLNKLSMVMDPYFHCIYGGQYQPYSTLVNNVQMKADSVQVTVWPYSGRWSFISFPFDVNVSDIKCLGEGTTSYVIRRYSGANRAAGESGSTWQTLGSGDVLKAGEGYILQAVRYIGNSWQNYTTMVFTAADNENKNRLLANSDAKQALNEYPAEQLQNRGWNLVGNPYPCYYDSRFIDFEAPITVWDLNRSTYRVYSPIDDSYVLVPGEAFFVQCPTGVSEIVFDKEGRQKNNTVRELSSPAKAPFRGSDRTVVNLSVRGEQGEDATRIVLNDLASMAYESTRDAAKFFSPEESVPQLFTVEGEVMHAINERPLGTGDVALGVSIGESGVYTISLDSEVSGYKVILDDLMSGKSVRLDGSEGYTFTAEKGMDSHRFALHFTGNGTNSAIGIETDSDTEDASGVFTIDGKPAAYPMPGNIYIKNGKKVYIK